MCEFSKLIRMICVILSFQIGYNLVLSRSSKSFVSTADIDPSSKKSAFNNWSLTRFQFEVTIRV